MMQCSYTSDLTALSDATVFSPVVAVLFIHQRRKKEKEALMISQEDIRDNVIHYDDEGGGEADTRAFDMGTLRNQHAQQALLQRPAPPSGKESSGYGEGILPHLSGRTDDVRSPDIHRQTVGLIAAAQPTPPSGGLTEENAETIREFIEHRLVESQRGCATLPYDSLATYAYEGDGSLAGSLSSIEESWIFDDGGDFSFLGDWGQPFKTLAGIMEKNPATLTEESGKDLVAT